jgi:phage shock protein A
MKRLIGLFASGLLLLILIGLYFEHQTLQDWWLLRNYVAPAPVAAIASRDTFTQEGQTLFYVNKPSIEDKSVFAGHCKTAEQSIVLGCYVNTEGIYLLNVTDTRLQGVEEVTAAHEMLHAAYDRLSKSQRAHIDDLTAKAFAAVKDDRIIANVADYRKRDASVVPNELHSILATEVRVLPAELETYYKQYFNDRLKIVGFSEQYEQVFEDLKTKVASYDTQLEALKPQIDQLEAQVNLKGNTLEQTKKQMDALLASGQRDAYNAQVNGFNAQVRAYNTNVVKLKNLIDQYNNLVNQRNALATTQRDLVQSIDSRFTEK